MRNVIIFLGALSAAACAGAAPAAAPATPTVSDTPATAAPTEETTPAPEAPAPVVDSKPAVAASAPRELLLSAVCTSSTKKKCAADDPCCNACTAMHWEPAQSENLTAADGKPYALTGSALPDCKWPRGQCKCPFDLRARGQLNETTFVVESFEQLPRTH